MGIVVGVRFFDDTTVISLVTDEEMDTGRRMGVEIGVTFFDGTTTSSFFTDGEIGTGRHIGVVGAGVSGIKVRLFVYSTTLSEELPDKHGTRHDTPRVLPSGWQSLCRMYTVQ